MSTINVTTITNGTDSISIEKVTKTTAAAWADVASSGAVNNGYNIASIANGISPAIYTVTFTNPMSSANYAIIGSSTASTGGTDGVNSWFSVVSQTASGFVYQVRTTISGGLPGTGKDEDAFFVCYE